MRTVQPELHDPVAEDVDTLVVLVGRGVGRDDRRDHTLRRRRTSEHTGNAVAVGHHGAVAVFGAVDDAVVLARHGQPRPISRGSTGAARYEPTTSRDRRSQPAKTTPSVATSSRPNRTTHVPTDRAVPWSCRHRAATRADRPGGSPRRSPTPRHAGCAGRRRRDGWRSRTRRHCGDDDGTRRGSRSTRARSRRRAAAGSRAGDRRTDRSHRRRSTARPPGAGPRRADRTHHERRRSHRTSARGDGRPRRSARRDRGRHSRSRARRATPGRRGSTRDGARRSSRRRRRVADPSVGIKHRSCARDSARRDSMRPAVTEKNSRTDDASARNDPSWSASASSPSANVTFARPGTVRSTRPLTPATASIMSSPWATHGSATSAATSPLVRSSTTSITRAINSARSIARPDQNRASAARVGTDAIRSTCGNGSRRRISGGATVPPMIQTSFAVADVGALGSSPGRGPERCRPAARRCPCRSRRDGDAASRHVRPAPRRRTRDVAQAPSVRSSIGMCDSGQDPW